MKTKTIYMWSVRDVNGKRHRPRWHMTEDEIRAMYPNARELQRLGSVSFEVGETQEEIDALARKRSHSTSDFDGGSLQRDGPEKYARRQAELGITKPLSEE